MEILTVLIISGFIGWFFSKSLQTKTKTISKSNIIRIDDKNWVVNNELISLEKDTPLKRMEQEAEDNKHFRNYETYRLKDDRERLKEEWLKTKSLISKMSKVINCISPEKLLEITKKYSKYILVCHKIGITNILTKEEFLIKEENHFMCNSMKMPLYHGGGVYRVHNEITARYYNGNMHNKMKKEFENKWY